MQFPLEVTCGPLASLRAKNSGRPGRPVWGWGDLQSGRRSTACCGRQAAATRYGTSSLSESPSGRDGTLAHPEQLARCCRGPRNFAATAPSEERVSCSAFVQVHLERREEKGCLRHGQQCAATARTTQSVTGSFHCRPRSVRAVCVCARRLSPVLNLCRPCLACGG